MPRRTFVIRQPRGDVRERRADAGDRKLFADGMQGRAAPRSATMTGPFAEMPPVRRSGSLSVDPLSRPGG